MLEDKNGGCWKRSTAVLHRSLEALEDIVDHRVALGHVQDFAVDALRVDPELVGEVFGLINDPRSEREDHRRQNAQEKPAEQDDPARRGF
ncbi:MAG: hypothetical protein A2521_16545 [Deltaproteobacteria bacterium RIFOXYD12_FULL_57_12]|nr:MAG: hypothetical protein A2521_16545 [Deltaproteobacteria bacterium RIFOXYD12_FULL_57_12]